MYLSTYTAPLALSFWMVAATVAQADDEHQNESLFHCGTGDLSGQSIPDLLEDIYPANVTITTRKGVQLPFGITPESGKAPSGRAPGAGFGSGFIIDPEKGLVVTNAHVLEGPSGNAEENSFTVQFFDPEERDYKGEKLEAKLVGTDSSSGVDVAVLEYPAKKAQDFDTKPGCVHFGDSNEVRVGETALVIGNGLNMAFALTKGTISHTQRQSQSPFHDFIQTDAAINSGNSGGGLYDRNGKVVGVNTAIATKSGDSAGIGFAIPSNTVVDAVKKLIENGSIERGWLGARVQNINEQTASQYGAVEGEGVLVRLVEPDSPASIGGLQKSDIILKVNNDSIRDAIDLMRAISDIRPQTIADIGVLRDGQIITLPIKLGEREPEPPRPQAPEDSPGSDPDQQTPKDKDPEDKLPENQVPSP